MTMRLLIILLLTLALGVSARAAVEFPGVDPGPAVVTQQGDLLTLQNAIVSSSWRAMDGVLRPAKIENRLTGKQYDQVGAELFRLSTRPAATGLVGFCVAIRLTADRVTAAASRDGVEWQDLASYPRSSFAGSPRVVRIGKMSGDGRSTDNPGDRGADGRCVISDLTPVPAGTTGGPYDFAGPAHVAAVTDFPFPASGTSASCRIDKATDQGMTWGPALALIWDDGKRFMVVGVRDAHGTFNVETAAGQQVIAAKLDPFPTFDLAASTFRLTAPPILVHLTGRPDGVRLADRIGGAALEADLSADAGVRVHWRAELRDGSNYIRQTVTLAAPQKTVDLTAVELADLRVAGLTTIGTCPGCPVAGDGVFAGVEIPGSRDAVGPDGARIGFACKLKLSASQSYDFGQVVGVWPHGQLRRSFLHYVERERARPSRPFLHYNCWYDLGFNVSDASMVEAATAFHRELVVARGVPVQSYVVDDGWDDPNRGLWVENLHKFPGGFPQLGRELEALGSHLGTWISPLGGYGSADERTADARKMKLIPSDGQLDLSYPAYKQWFQERCLQLMRESGVNYFKWDRAGAGVTPHFLALLDVARRLRLANPEVFINVTVGTWPSPFWLNHVDSTWRNGTGDVGWAGKGDDLSNPVHGRERWLTFRDGSCHQCFVVPSPLYPLNSVMHHGIVNGRFFQGKDIGTDSPNLRHEARSYFATGATLQELYLTPSMMTPQAWNDVADAARWAHANADVLVDAHWVGGDPLKLEPYGYAAWNRRKATLMLRNPDDRPRTIDIDPAVAFELPPDAPKRFRVNSPYADAPAPLSEMVADRTQTITLQPFAVLVLDIVPVP
jgi:hypothetical protein